MDQIKPGKALDSAKDPSRKTGKNACCILLYLRGISPSDTVLPALGDKLTNIFKHINIKPGVHFFKYLGLVSNILPEMVDEVAALGLKKLVIEVWDISSLIRFLSSTTDEQENN